MIIYQVLELREGRIFNIIAAYTKLEEAGRELNWRIRTSEPSYRPYQESPYLDALGRSVTTYDPRPSRHKQTDFQIMETELITDKFTEFALKE